MQHVGAGTLGDTSLRYHAYQFPVDILLHDFIIFPINSTACIPAPGKRNHTDEGPGDTAYENVTGDETFCEAKALLQYYSPVHK